MQELIYMRRVFTDMLATASTKMVESLKKEDKAEPFEVQRARTELQSAMTLLDKVTAAIERVSELVDERDQADDRAEEAERELAEIRCAPLP